MKRQGPWKWLALLIFGIQFGVGDSVAQMSFGNMFQMVGGMDTVKNLASSVLQSSASDPRLAGVLGKADTGAMTPKLAEQMCSMLGGGCKPPLSEQQIAAGAGKLDETQTKALGDNFSSSLKNVTDNPLVRDG